MWTGLIREGYLGEVSLSKPTHPPLGTLLCDPLLPLGVDDDDDTITTTTTTIIIIIYSIMYNRVATMSPHLNFNLPSTPM